jgi:hypothetical protein
MNIEEKFIEDLDILSKEQYKETAKIICECDNIISFKFIVDISDDMKEKYSLNDDIEFVIDANPEVAQMEYHYKGMKMEPVCHYIRPENYHEVSELTMLHECIKQDTHKPNIIHLERGITKEND